MKLVPGTDIIETHITEVVDMPFVTSINHLSNTNDPFLFSLESPPVQRNEIVLRIRKASQSVLLRQASRFGTKILSRIRRDGRPYSRSGKSQCNTIDRCDYTRCRET